VRRLDAVLLALAGLLVLALAVAGARVAERYQQGGAWRAELGRGKLTALEPAMKAQLDSLSDNLVFTYYVSARRHMPSAMKRVERDVTDLLGALRAAAPGRVDVHIVDPETDPEQKSYASNRRITPFRVRDVAHDAYSERLVWSTLSMGYGTHAEVVVNGITPARLPRLQATLLEHLRRMDAGSVRPRVALAAPDGFGELEGALAELGDVARVDLDGGAPFPADADLVFWMRPAHVEPARLREIERALARGRSVVVAGSLLTVPADGITVDASGERRVRVERSEGAADLAALLAHFGLRAEPTLVLDAFAESLLDGEREVPAPFLLRCIAPNQNFVTWRNQPNGTLLFHAPTPLELDSEVLAELGMEARVHATTSDDTWQEPPPFDALGRPFSALERAHGAAASKLPLMVSLQPNDPWRGRLIALGASTPFEDGSYSRAGTAHWRLVRTLFDELGTQERLVAAATADAGAPAPAPELTGAARALWRGAVIALVPLLLLSFAVARGVVRRGSNGAGGTGGVASRQAGVWPRAVLALVVAAGIARVAAWPRLRVDATADGVNSLSAESRAVARRAGEIGAIEVEFVFSAEAKLPPAMRARLGRVRGALADFARAGADLALSSVDVGGLDDTARSALEQSGIEPVRVTTRDDEVTTVRTIYSALRLARGERVEILPFPDAASFEALEFRLAFALWRLETGRAVKIAFAADAERRSAAQDYDMQQAGLFAPKGNDPFSLARTLLERLDFDVENVTPRQFVATRETKIPADADLVVWMQPRRSIDAMMEETVRYLHGGGNVLIAAEHFKINSRQYRGRAFQMSYWPEPKNPDIEQIYLPEIGVDFVRDVLFDDLYFETWTDTEVFGRSGKSDFERQLSARPFQIRVAASNFAPDHPITRNLGDQAFLFGNRIVLDEAKLAALGLRATVLMTTTERAWTFPWKGGFLEEDPNGKPPPSEHIGGPPPDPDGQPAYLGKLPLAVLVEGGFPKPEKALRVVMGAEPGAAEADPLAGYPPSAPGKLMLIGCSSAFRDERLSLPDFRGDRLLLNSVACLALPPELAAIATRHPTVRGFGYVEPDEKLEWRSIVVAAPPLAILLLGGVVLVVRRRGPRRSPERGAAA
jgi:hypothetical protein